MTFRHRLDTMLWQTEIRAGVLSSKLRQAFDWRPTAQKNLEKAIPLDPETRAQKRDRDARQATFDKYWKVMFPYERSNDPVFRRRERRILQDGLSPRSERRMLAELWRDEHRGHGYFEYELWRADARRDLDHNGERPVLKRVLDFQRKIGDEAYRQEHGALARRPERLIEAERKHNRRILGPEVEYGGSRATVPEDPRVFMSQLQSRIIRAGVVAGTARGRALAKRVGMPFRQRDKNIIAELNPDDENLHEARAIERTDKRSTTRERERGDRRNALRDAARRMGTSIGKSLGRAKLRERGGGREP